MSQTDKISSPLHETPSKLNDLSEGTSAMQRSAMPPPFQLVEAGGGAGAAQGESGEAEPAQLMGLESGEGEGFTSMPILPQGGAGQGGTVLQRVEDSETEGATTNSHWVGKPARVSTQGYRVREERDSSLDPIDELGFDTWVMVNKAWPGDWLEILTDTGVHGFVGIPGQNLMPLPEADQSASLHRVESGESAIGIAEQYFSQHVRQGMDLRFFVAVLAQLNNIAIPDSVSGWRDTQVQAGSVIYIPSIYYITSQEGLVNTGSYSQETLDFITETAELIQQVTQDVLASAQIAQSIIADGWMDAVVDGVQGAIEDKIRELLRRLLIVAGTTAIGALIGALVGGAGAAPGAALGYEIGLMIVNGIEFIEMIASIATIMETFATALGRYATLCLRANGDEETIQEAGQVLGEAVLFAIQILVEELVDSKVLSPDVSSTTTDGPDSTNTSESTPTTDRPNETADPVTPETVNETGSGGSSQSIISSTVESRTHSAGFRQATEMRLPEAPAGHIWVAGPDLPHLRRQEGVDVDRKYYDPETGTIVDVPSTSIAHRATIEAGSQNTVDHSELSADSLSELERHEQLRNQAMAERDAAEVGTEEHNQAMQDMRQASESIGMVAAEAAFMSQNPGAVKLDFSLLGTSSGVFDLVFDVDGQIHILEVKGGGSPTLGTRNTADGRAQQGTSAYRDSIIASMRGRLINMIQGAQESGAMEAMERANAQLNNLELIDDGATYQLAHQRIDSEGNVAGGVSFSTFDTSGSE